MAERNMMSIDEIQMEQVPDNTPMQFENVSDLKSIAKVMTDADIEKELHVIEEINQLTTTESYDPAKDTILQAKKKELFEKQANQKKGIFEISSGTIAFSSFHSVSIDKETPIYVVQHRNMIPDMYQNGFYEIVGKEITYQGNTYKQKHIRPYLDIDMKQCIENNTSGYDLFNSIINWCDHWKQIFGDYSVSAYTNNPRLSQEKNIHYNKDSEKHLSMHIVFYECKMEIEEFKYLWEPDFFDIPIGMFDKSVYDGLLSRRTMRLHLSPKKKFANSPLVHDCGRIIDNKPFSTQFITPTGKERIVYLHQVIGSQLWFKEKEVIENTEDRTAMHNNNMSLELFEALVKGFDRSIQIHAEQGINCFKIITSLNACENEHITVEKIEEAKKYICYNADLTTKASLRFWEIDSACDRKGKCANSAGFLYKIIKEKRPDYFKASILPLIAPKTQFVDSDYSFDDYLMKYQHFTTKQQHYNALAKCIAVNTSDGGYIRKSISGNNVVYQLITCGCIKKEFNKKIVLPTTEEEREKMREQKKKIQDQKEYRLSDIIQDAERLDKLLKFQGMSLMPGNPNILWQYRPPRKTDYNKELIEEWLAFMKTRVVHEKPLMEELYSHAYRFRHPTAFIEKFFIHHETQGNSGKSFLAGCLAEMYPELMDVGVKPKEATNLYSTLYSEKLMVWLEEVDKQKKLDFDPIDLASTIKRITTINGSERPLYQKSRAVKHCAITGMNSNDETLFGLIRSDRPTQSRLVIVEFKKTIYTEDEFKRIADYYIKNSEFAYSLYKYLKDDLEIPDSFCISRYNSIEKDEFIKQACEKKQNTLESWFDDLISEYTLISLQDFKNGFGRGTVFIETKNKKTGITYVFQKREWFIGSYNKYIEEHKGSFKYDENALIAFIEHRGFEYINSRAFDGRSYKIEMEKFTKFSTNTKFELIEDGDDWE